MQPLPFPIVLHFAILKKTSEVSNKDLYQITHLFQSLLAYIGEVEDPHICPRIYRVLCSSFYGLLSRPSQRKTMPRSDQPINGVEQIRANARNAYPSVGLLNKTLSLSPAVRWALPARIRHKDKDDLVVVGDDFIQIHQIETDGRLTHVATKSDFDCLIFSAKVFGDPLDDKDGKPDNDSNHDIKPEHHEMDNQSSRATTMLPPQCLVLTLQNQHMVFMFASEDSEGSINFNMCSYVPLPSWPSPTKRPGKHLAIDPKSRAIAVAAPEGKVILYSAQPIDTDAQWGVGFLPVSSEIPIKTPGAIMCMDFLHPSESDPDHVILVVLVVDRGKTRMYIIDWENSVGTRKARRQGAFPMANCRL